MAVPTAMRPILAQAVVAAARERQQVVPGRLEVNPFWGHQAAAAAAAKQRYRDITKAVRAG